MKILIYDCFSGISGDMNLGAMIDLGVEPDYLIRELEKLNLEGYSLSFVADQRKGINGTRAIVKIHENSSSHHLHSIINTEHLKSFNSAKFQISHQNSGEHGRNFGDIKKLIEKSNLSVKVKELSIGMFTKVAVAEAKIHGKSVDEVHFHEVGALDSIIDIIGAAICIDFLKPDKIICLPVELGGGMVKCAHGVFPVPAPATAEILKNIPVKSGAIDKEATTPTGAAIIASLANEFTDKLDIKITKVAYGIGFRDNPVPNVLRVYLAEENLNNTGIEINYADVIECNIDDMVPEQYEFIMEKLFEAGADDVYLQPIVMKKSRPAITLSVLCKTSLTPIIENIILTETSSLGLRKYRVEKKMLSREYETITTQWGPVKIKYGLHNGKRIKMKPEYGDCSAIAKKYQISLNKVYDEIHQLTTKTK